LVISAECRKGHFLVVIEFCGRFLLQTLTFCVSSNFWS